MGKLNQIKKAIEAGRNDGSIFDKMGRAYSKRNHAVRAFDDMQKRVTEMEGWKLDDAEKAKFARLLMQKNKKVNDAGLAQQRIDLIPKKQYNKLQKDAIDHNALIDDMYRDGKEQLEAARFPYGMDAEPKYYIDDYQRVSPAYNTEDLFPEEGFITPEQYYMHNRRLGDWRRENTIDDNMYAPLYGPDEVLDDQYYIDKAFREVRSH